MSRLFIKNGYCCGHGKIVQRLKNWCIIHQVPYVEERGAEVSTATYEGITVELTPTLTLSQALTKLGLISPKSA